MVADQALDIRALKDVLAKKRLRPAVKRQMVAEVMSSLSQRRACGLIGITRRSFRRVLGEDRNRLLRRRLRELAEERHRWGPTLYLLMRRKGFKANHKRVERLYREEGLSLHRRRKRLSHLRVMRSQPLSANQTWAADFIHDSLFNGRRFRAFAVLDEWSRESVAIEALGRWWRDCSKVRSSGFLCRADNA